MRALLLLLPALLGACRTKPVCYYPVSVQVTPSVRYENIEFCPDRTWRFSND